MISMKRLNKMAGRILNIAIIALMLLTPASYGMAQGKKAQGRGGGGAQKEEARVVVVAQANNKNDTVRAAELYKSSLQDLLVRREEDAKRAAEQLGKLRELYTDGIISRRELEENEKALADARAKVDEVRRKIEATDQLIAESMVESEIAETANPLAASTSVSKVRRVAYFRYNGTANWSLSDVPKVENFFSARFGRRLPVNAFGQSDLHNRWGYDHRDALDVGLHPDSAEGQALMAYLRSAGIPFIAFRRDVPGSATGPHIHIGRPSHKTTAR